MVSSTILAFATIFLISFRAPASLFALCPEVLSLGVLLAGFLWGPRAVAVLLTVGWSMLTAAWVMEDRLAPELHGQDIALTGVVCDVPAVNGGVQRFPLVIDTEARGPGVPARVQVSWYDTQTPVRAGERWRLTIRMKRPRGARNPAGFDFERWAFMRTIGATGYVRPSLTNRQLASADQGGCKLAAFRQRIASDLQAAVPDGRAVEYMVALAVGVRTQLDDEDWQLLRRTGTAHLMAISGLHIGLAAGFAFFCSRQIGRWLLLARVHCQPLALARIGALAGALAYSALAGFSIPTTRALVMTAAVIVLTSLRRTIPAPVVLTVALFAILWIAPFAMLSAGFWLSFGAVAVLLLAGFGGTFPTRESPSRVAAVWRRFRQVLRAQLCLSVGLLPATGFFFGQVSVVAPLANLLVVPLFALAIVPLLIVGIIALLVAPALASPVLGLVDAILAQAIAFLALLNDWSAIAFDVPRIPGISVAISLVIVVALLWPRPLPARISVVLLLSALAAGAGTGAVAPAIRVVVMDVGQGLAVLMQTPHHTVLFDTGPRYRRGDAGRSVVLPVLRYFGVTHLDRIVVSHADADHVGGAGSVLAAYPQAKLLAPERLDLAVDRFSLCRAGQYWRRDGVSFRVLHPGAGADAGRWSKNDASCVLLVQSASFSLLLPGDIEQRAERWLAGKGRLPPVDLVIVPHHGSRTSSTPSFVAATRPVYAVFSAGYRNQWGFPVPDVRQRWLAGGTCTLATGALGALVFEAQHAGPLRLVKRYRVDTVRVWNEVESIAPAGAHCRSLTSTN